MCATWTTIGYSQTTRTSDKSIVSAVFARNVSFDIKRSRFVQECFAAGDVFVRDSAEQFSRIDTIFVSGRHRSHPAQVVAIARHCLMQFPVTTIDPFELPTMMKLAIIAGDTGAVRTVLNRRLAAVNSVRHHVALLDSAFYQVANDFRPVPINFLRGLLVDLGNIGDDALYNRGRAQLFLGSMLAEHNATPDSVLEQLQAAAELLKRVSPEALSGFEKAGYEMTINTYIPAEIGWWTFLRDGTETAFLQWVKAGTKRTPTLPIGRFIPPLITGEDWFETKETEAHGKQSERMANPPAITGAITLVTALGTRGSAQGSACVEALERIHRRFPTVSFVLIAETKGFFQDVRMSDPTKESLWLAHYYLDSLQLSGVLNVSHTRFDTTRVTANGDPLWYATETMDALGLQGDCGNAYVLDRRGRIVQFFQPVANYQELLYGLERLLQFPESK